MNRQTLQRAIGAIVAILLFGLAVFHGISSKNGEAKQGIRSRRSFDDDDDLFVTSSPGGGAIYIRWGRHECPNTNTEVVYKGSAAGSWYDHYGGGANYICLTEKPVWGRYNDIPNNGRLYGAEFELTSHGEHKNFPFSQQNFQSLHNHDVPCILCRSIERSTQVMVPGTSVCMEGWTREYDGYLVAGHYGHKGRQEFVCMDADPEANASGYKSDDGALFYSVEVQCGSLPCPPYIQNRELTCVVCTR